MGMAAQGDILAERLNAEPAIFKGCSSTELGAIVLAAIIFWLPASLGLAAALGALTMGFGLAGIGIVGSVVSAATLLQAQKRNRPEGYYQQRLVLWCHRRGLRRSRLVIWSGVWDLGRQCDGTL